MHRKRVQIRLLAGCSTSRVIFLGFLENGFSKSKPSMMSQMLQVFVLYFIREEKESMTAVVNMHQSIKALFEGLYLRQEENKHET